MMATEPRVRGDSGVQPRAATAADIPLLQWLAEKTWRASYSEMLAPEQIDYMLGWMHGEETIASELAEGVVWQIAEVEGEPVGYYSWRLAPQDAEPENARARLHKLYVLPGRQRQGCGCAMLAHALADAEARGVREMSLSVNKNNHGAQRLYRRAGFQIASEVVFEIGAGFVMDDFIMVRGLADCARVAA